MRGLLFLLVFTTTIQATPPSACIPCHPIANSGMTQALQPGQALKGKLTTQIGPYVYEINNSTYTVRDGKETFQTPINWVFGQGTVGQTYLYERDGRWYESRVSYFSEIKGLDITMGQQDYKPNTLEQAAGRLTTPAEAAKCFDCHATNVRKSDLSQMIAGVQCERCHGPAEAHLQTKAAMRKLGSLTTEEMSDFCGQCHRTWSYVATNGPHGIQNIRFQPYRLANSKCYDAADNRIRCTTCHDPHRAVETTPAAYDAKCLACHATKPCRVATKDCVTCHMPKLDLPGAHNKFTDHRIRIVRANEPYPD